MKKLKAFVTRGFPGEGMARLEEKFEVDLNPGWRVPDRAEMMARMADADVMLTYNDRIDAEMIQNAPKLKLIVDNWGGRFGTIDMEAAEAAGIRVTGAPPSYGWIIDGVADIVWGMMIAAGRRFHEGTDLIEAGNFTHSENSNHLLLGEGLSGRTVGILGAGRIGRAVAKRAPGFGVELIYLDVEANAEIEELGAKRVSKEEFFQTADYVTVHLSDIDENVHFIGKAELAMMKPAAYVVNTARGRMIDEAALVSALQNGTIAGAALEVYEFEPMVSEPLLRMKNVLLLPHIGGALFKERAFNFSRMVDECIKVWEEQR